MPGVHRNVLLIAACAGIFVFGMVLALLGTVFGLPGMRERLGIDVAGQGDVFLWLYFGILVASLAAGPTIDRFGNKVVLVLSAAMVAAALAGFAFATSLASAAVAALLMGAGGGGLNTATNALVSDLYGDARGTMLNILGIFFGFGGLCMPFLAASLAATFTIQQLLLGAAAPALVAGVAFAALAFPPPREVQGFSLVEAGRAVRQPGVLLMAVLLLFASGNEAAIGGWTTTYLAQSGTPADVATWVLTGYWACMMAGRLLAARLLRWVTKERLILVSGLGAAAGCLMLVAADALAWRAAGVWIAGLCFAPIFPTTLAIAGDRYARFAGSVFSVLFGVALLGGMSFPWAIGQMAGPAGIRAGLLLPVIGSLLISVLLLALTRNTSAPAAKS